MNEPTICVLMPVYYGDDLNNLILAVNSVLNQTLLPNQIVIVVDGPIRTEVINFLNATSEHNNLIEIVKLENNIGLPGALNYGLKFVKSDWVARFDADDLMVPNRLEVQKEFIVKNQVDVIGGQIREFDENNNWCERLVPTDIQSIKKLIPWRNPMNHVTVMYKTNLIKQYWYRNISGYEDYDLWFRLLKNPKVKFVNLKNNLVDVRGGSQMYLRRAGLTYALGELRFRFVTSRYSENILKHWVAGILRSLISIFPSKVKALFYKNLLRKGL